MHGKRLRFTRGIPFFLLASLVALLFAPTITMAQDDATGDQTAASEPTAVATEPPPPVPTDPPPPVATDPLPPPPTEPPLPTVAPTIPPATEVPAVEPSPTDPAPTATTDESQIPSPTVDPTVTPDASPTPTPSPTPTVTPPPPAALGLPWPLPSGYIAIYGGGPLNGLAMIWNYGGFGISQEYGHTEFSVSHGSWYSCGINLGLDGYAHPGIDISMPRGTWLYSPVNGTVVVSGNSSGYTFYGNGNANVGQLRIRTDSGDEVVLGHMGRIAVNVGDRVAQGQFVGVSGGFNGDHLHLETVEAQSGGWYRAVDPRNSFLVDAIATGGEVETEEVATEPPAESTPELAPATEAAPATELVSAGAETALGQAMAPVAASLPGLGQAASVSTTTDTDTVSEPAVLANTEPSPMTTSLTRVVEYQLVSIFPDPLQGTLPTPIQFVQRGMQSP